MILSARDYKDKAGSLGKQRQISEYSVTPDRRVVFDRSNARYLYEPNLRPTEPLDLYDGWERFKDKYFERPWFINEPSLYLMCQWAVGSEMNSLEEVFAADFVSWRGTFKRLALTPFECKRPWRVVAMRCGQVILLAEQTHHYKEDASSRQDTFSGYKFEQYMTSDRQGELPKTHEDVDCRPTFEVMVRSELRGADGGTLSICCGGEVDGIRQRGENEELLELKTVREGRPGGQGLLAKVVQSELVGVTTVLTGIKSGKQEGKAVVKQVLEETVAELATRANPKRGECYAFLYDLLSAVKKFTQDGVDSCEISLDKQTKEVWIRSVTMGERAKHWNRLSEEFKKKFNLNN